LSYDLKWFAQSTIYRDSVDLLAVRDGGVDTRDVVQPLQFVLQRVERHLAVEAPSMALSPQSARSLMQALWDAGVRPLDPTLSSPAEVTALKAHIKFAEGVTGALLGRFPATVTAPRGE
jgi:hypothetical protein